MMSCNSRRQGGNGRTSAVGRSRRANFKFRNRGHVREDSMEVETERQVHSAVACYNGITESVTVSETATTQYSLRRREGPYTTPLQKNEIESGLPRGTTMPSGSQANVCLPAPFLETYPPRSKRSGQQYPTGSLEKRCKSTTKIRPRSSLTDDTDLDTDTIYAIDPSEDTLDAIPAQVPHGYGAEVPAHPPKKHFIRKLFSKSSFEHPDHCSEVRIKHEHADDPVLGDEFGVQVATFRFHDSVSKETYYQHFLNGIKPGSPAEKMSIRTWDELVLLNERFVPRITHDEVIKLFENVPVDSLTRLTLVLRRIVTNPDGFDWIRSSAILIPELPKEPSVRELKFENLGRNPDFQWRNWYYLKVEGTQLFVSPDRFHKTVLFDTLADKSSDGIKQVMLSCRLSGVSHLQYQASLQFRDDGYIAMNNTTQVAELRATECWYKFSQAGSAGMFQIQDTNNYLGRRSESNRMEAVSTAFKFGLYPPDGTWDQPDGAGMPTHKPWSLNRSANSGDSGLPSSLDSSDVDGASSSDSSLTLSDDHTRSSDVTSVPRARHGYGSNGNSCSVLTISACHRPVTRQMSASTPTYAFSQLQFQ